MRGAEDSLAGRWVSEQSSLVSLDLTGRHSLVLEHQFGQSAVERSRTEEGARIEALSGRITPNFTSKDDDVRPATLEAVSFDALTFRKQN